MAGILVVCSGNICRSPIAEGLLRRALERRLDRAAPPVGSAGTIAVDGAPAMPESIEAARERGADIRAHAARHLTPALIEDADLIVGMAAEHREAVGRRKRRGDGTHPAIRYKPAPALGQARTAHRR